MKLQDYRETYYEFTGKVSDISRQLAFAGIAVIWIFKKDAPGTGLTVPGELLLPDIFIVLALSFDLLQYCIGTVTWFFFYRIKEMREVSEEAELGRHSEWLDVPINTVFWFKVICLGAAYVLILRFLLRTLSFT
jgi:hypothetical protein